VPNFKHI